MLPDLFSGLCGRAQTFDWHLSNSNNNNQIVSFYQLHTQGPGVVHAVTQPCLTGTPEWSRATCDYVTMMSDWTAPLSRHLINRTGGNTCVFRDMSCRTTLHGPKYVDAWILQTTGSYFSVQIWECFSGSLLVIEEPFRKQAQFILNWVWNWVLITMFFYLF